MSEHSEDETTRRELDVNGESPSEQIAVAVADIKGVEATDLEEMYGCVDGVLDHVFSDPPAPEARLQVEFSYEGYRVTIEQDGDARFVELDARS